MAPSGTQVLIHEKPDQRASWDPYGVDGWYTGPALDHYRCITAYLPSTSQERISDTAEFFPHTIPLPTTTDAHYLKQAADDILAVLNKPKPTLPYIQAGDAMRDAIESTAQLSNRAIKREVSPEPKVIKKISPSQPYFTHPPVPRVVKPDDNENITVISNSVPHLIQNFNAPYTTPPVTTNIIFQPTINHIYNPTTGKRETPDSLLNGPDKSVWNKATSNEFGR